jgi:hypothetical protein
VTGSCRDATQLLITMPKVKKNSSSKVHLAKENERLRLELAKRKHAIDSRPYALDPSQAENPLH